MTRNFRILEATCFLGLLACGYWVFGVAPIETEMGFVQKIMYLHLPAVLVTYAGFFVTFAFSIAYLWKRQMLFDQVAKCSAEVALLFCGMVLITGAIWGKPTWGTYWVWDARLTTTLLLFFIFFGYFLLRQFSTSPQRAARLSAIVGIVGFLDIPIIHKSVEWWRTLHQPTTLFKVTEAQARPSMPNELLYPLLACLVMGMVVYAYLLWLRMVVDQQEFALDEALNE